MPRLSIQIPSSKQFQLPIGLFCLIALLLSGCSSNIGSSKKEPALENPSISTHFKEPGAAATLPPVKQIVTEEPVKFWLSPDLPSFIKDDFQVHQSTIQVDSAEEADLQLIPISRDAMENIVVTTRWVYALVTPFPTLTDYVSSIDIRKAWRGEETGQFSGRPLLLSEETRRVFTLLWGEPDENGIKVLPADQLLAEAWSKQPAWALIPFEELQPRWKVLTVDGLNPFEKQMDVEKYPLAADFGFTGKQEILSKILENQTDWVSIPSTNRHPDKMTVLVMTGTTALTRGTAERMETMGVHYPAEKILPWLKDADLTHISHEIPFSEDCPPAVPVRTDWNFCSDPSYIELLKYIDADIIELTGNHIMDWGAGDLLYSLKLYMENSFLTYGGGQDLEAARQPLLVEDHGNKLAFLGCTQPGPAYAWATDETPGNAPCDRNWMVSQVERLSARGYLVIVTYQHMEEYDYSPLTPQRGDFQSMAEAGAVVVSGSQSHFPQGMSFFGDQFLHYGLGNLFFDQMDEPVVGTRREFIDRHVFYDGRYIGTQLLTAMLEDHAQPRPMTSDERKALLRDAFKVSVW